MKKVELTKKQADAVFSALKERSADELVAMMEFDLSEGRKNTWFEGSEELNRMSIALVAKALYIGYDVKLTKEEQLLEAWKNPNMYSNSLDETYRRGIEKAIEIMGIKIDLKHDYVKY